MGKGLTLSTRRIEVGTEHILLVLGWGNDFDQPGVRWFVDRLTGANYSVTIVRIPTDLGRFRERIVSPVLEVASGMDRPTVIAHSMGGIAARYLTDAQRRIFLSPYWGIPKHRHIPFMDIIIPALSWLSVPLFPRGYDQADLGDLMTDDDSYYIPSRISVRSINGFRQAQAGMPPLRDDDSIYYSRTDAVVDIERIEEAGCRKYEYTGGHAFFTSDSREKVFTDILYDLRSHP